MIFKIVYKELGGHTHLRLWTGPHEGRLGLAGAVSMTNDEFHTFMIMMGAPPPGTRVITEEQQVTVPSKDSQQPR